MKFFVDINPSDRTMVLRSTQLLVPGRFPGGKSGRCVSLTNLPPFCAVVMKSGPLNFLEPSWPLQDCNGTSLTFTLFIYIYIYIYTYTYIYMYIYIYIYISTYEQSKIISYQQTWTVMRVSVINWHPQGKVNTKKIVISIDRKSRV